MLIHNKETGGCMIKGRPQWQDDVCPLKRREIEKCLRKS